MLTFREFKENTLSSLKSKVAEALEVKKQEMARSMFNESKSEVEKLAGKKTITTKSGTATGWYSPNTEYKVSSISDGHYSHKPGVNVSHEGKIKFIPLKDIVVESVDINEAKGFGKGNDKMSYAVNIKGVNPDFYTEPFGRQMDDLRKIKEWTKTAKKGYVGAKGKSTMASVKQWVKDNKPSEFYARWKSDSSMYKDDSVEILFKESVDLNEGMGAFKAAAEVLKAFGGKKPSKMSDMMKFDSEIEKAAKKYDVSVDDILKVINK